MSRTQLSDFTFTFHFRALEKEIATHCSVLAWRIPGTGEPDGLPSMGSHRVRHNWSDLAAAAGLQPTRLPCPSPTPRTYSNSCPSSWWCHPAISSFCSNHPYRPLLLLPLIFPSIRVFSNESVLHIRWPEYWSLSFSISPSDEYSGLISFRMNWLDLPGVQGTLKSLLQQHSSKASILQHSAFFIVQLSHPDRKSVV